MKNFKMHSIRRYPSGLAIYGIWLLWILGGNAMATDMQSTLQNSSAIAGKPTQSLQTLPLMVPSGTVHQMPANGIEPSANIKDLLVKLLKGDQILGSSLCMVEWKGASRILEPCRILLVGSDARFTIYTLLETDCDKIPSLPPEACYLGSVVLSKIDGTKEVSATEFEIRDESLYTVFAMDPSLNITERGSIASVWSLVRQKDRYRIKVEAFDTNGELVSEQNWSGKLSDWKNSVERQVVDKQISSSSKTASAESRLDQKQRPLPPPPPPPTQSADATPSDGPTCEEYADLAQAQAELIGAGAEGALELLGLGTAKGEEFIAELNLDAEVLESLEITMGEDLGSNAEGIGVAAKLTEGVTEKLGAKGSARVINKITNMYNMRGKIENFSDAFANYTYHYVKVECKEQKALENKPDKEDEIEKGKPKGGDGSGGTPKVETCMHCSSCQEKYTEKTKRKNSGGIEEIEVIGTRGCVCSVWISMISNNCEKCDSATDCM